MNINLTETEIKVLKALYKSAEGNGHDFGFTEDTRNVLENSHAHAGVISSLIKKGVIAVEKTSSGFFTQFTWGNSPYDVEEMEKMRKHVKSILEKEVTCEHCFKTISETGRIDEDVDGNFLCPKCMDGV